VSSFVALLRAVNVGRGEKLPMKELKRLAEEAGFESVSTYIASGNLVFRSTDSAEKAKTILEQRIEDFTGIHIDVFIRTAREMKDLLDANPFPEEPGNKVAVLFLDRHPPADLERTATGVDGERFKPADREVFIHYPDGLGVSKLKLDVGTGTTRNMNTVTKLAGMAGAL
jgi:uncharacterized protein (DUF1697 family)